MIWGEHRDNDKYFSKIADGNHFQTISLDTWTQWPLTLYRSNYHCPSAWHHTDWHSCWPSNWRWWDPGLPAGSWCSSCAPSDCLWRSPDHSTAGCWPCWPLCSIRRRTTLRYPWCDPRCWLHSDWLWCVCVEPPQKRPKLIKLKIYECGEDTK